MASCQNAMLSVFPWTRRPTGPGPQTRFSHSTLNGELSVAGFDARLKYVETLWEAVGKLARDNRPLEEALSRIAGGDAKSSP